MKKHKLGPNGTIMTCLNIFASQIDKLINFIIEKKKNTKEEKKNKQIFIIDTPGQIEVFNWSASGQIISSSIASVIPTFAVFLADSVRCENPNTFMSNMLFCCSVLFRLKLPICILFNKSDLVKKEDRRLGLWVKDYDIFLEDLKGFKGSYLSSLSRSLCFALDDFYNELRFFFVSSLTQEGMDNFYDVFEELRKEYFDCYYQDLKISFEKLKIKKENELDLKKKDFVKDLKN